MQPQNPKNEWLVKREIIKALAEGTEAEQDDGMFGTLTHDFETITMDGVGASRMLNIRHEGPVCLTPADLQVKKLIGILELSHGLDIALIKRAKQSFLNMQDMDALRNIARDYFYKTDVMPPGDIRKDFCVLEVMNRLKKLYKGEDKIE